MSARRFIATKIHNFKDESGKELRLSPKGFFINHFYFVTRKEMKRILVTRGHYFVGSTVYNGHIGPARRYQLVKNNSGLQLGCQSFSPKIVNKLKAWAGVE